MWTHAHQKAGAKCSQQLHYTSPGLETAQSAQQNGQRNDNEPQLRASARGHISPTCQVKTAGTGFNQERETTLVISTEST